MCCYTPFGSKEMRERANPLIVFWFNKIDINHQSQMIWWFFIHSRFEDLETKRD